MLDGALWRSPPPHLSQPLLPTTTAIVPNLSLKTENVSGRLTWVQSLEGLHLYWGAIAHPPSSFKPRFGMRELEGDRPRTPLGTLNVLQLLLLNYTFTGVDNTLKLVTWGVNFDVLNLSVGGDRTSPITSKYRGLQPLNPSITLLRKRAPKKQVQESECQKVDQPRF